VALLPWIRFGGGRRDERHLTSLENCVLGGPDGERKESELPIADVEVDDASGVVIELGVGTMAIFVERNRRVRDTEDGSCHRVQVSGCCWGNSKVVVVRTNTHVTRLEM
jgi:hypothetical protein